MDLKVSEIAFQRMQKSAAKLKKSTDKRKLATATRQWVESTPKLHALNYLYYRFFTSEFELFLINKSEGE